MILSLVASVAGNYLTLRGLDEQLVVANQTLATYGESVRLFTLQFQYGQVSQMNVAQVQSQYETAAAQIPQIEIADRADRERAVGAGRPQSRARSRAASTIYRARAAEGAGGRAVRAARRGGRTSSRRKTTLIAANAQIGAARALYFPTISLTGAGGAGSAALNNLFTGPARVWSYAGHARPGPSSRSARSAARSRRRKARSRRRSTATSTRSRTRSPTSRTRWSRRRSSQQQLAAQERLVAALKDYARLAKLQYDGGYTSYTTVLQAEQSLFPAELTLASVRASVFSVEREHLQGDGRRLGRRSRQADRRRRAAARATARPGMPPLVLTCACGSA